MLPGGGFGSRLDRMEAERLFIETLDDLAERARWQSSEYALLRSAGLLRELLIDEKPLVCQVTKSGRPQPRYRIRRRKPEPSGDPWFWLGGIDPEHPVAPEHPDADRLAELVGAIETVDLKGLLAVQMICLGAEGRRQGGALTYLTVRDLIRYHAHVSGGVHHDAAWESQHLALEQFPVRIGYGTIPIELMAIASIAPVVLRGLAPLREAVEKDLAAQAGAG
jgi:hypothetical protein